MARDTSGWWTRRPKTVEVYDCREGTPRMVATARADDALVLPPFDDRIAVGDFWKRRLG